MQYATLFLSKVIDENNVQAIKRYGITERDMPTDVEKDAYRFILDYAEQNGGSAPSYAVLIEAVPEFEYVPDVTDSYTYLQQEIKDYAAKTALSEYLSNFVEKYNRGERGKNLLNDLIKEVERIKIETDVRKNVGTDVDTVREKFLSEFERRKEGKSFRIWRSRFDTINKTTGGYVSGNLYVIYGKSGRGKSVTAYEEAVEFSLQGANVLIWGMELPWFELWTRLIVSISGREGVATAEINGLEIPAGFDASAIRAGRMPADFEQEFREFVSRLNQRIPGNIIVRAVDDDDFTSRTVSDLEADIIATNADVVIIDPFYYMHFERNTSKTAGGDAAATSMKLRQLLGRMKVVGIAITQAEETKEERDENGIRELVLPQREHVKKTKQLLEDAYLLIAVDTDYKQGRGLIGLNKGRDGGEGEVFEIIYLPHIGVVRELETGEAAMGQFDF